MLRSGCRSAYTVTAAIKANAEESVLLWSPFSESGDKAFELFVHSDQQPSQFGRQFPRQHYLA